MKRVEANDPASICLLGNNYEHGNGGLQLDQAKAMDYTLGQQSLVIVRRIIV